MMTQIVVTLENGADSTMLQRMIENMKGVLRTTLKSNVKTETEKNTEEWIAKMNELSRSVDSSIVDLSDEKTRHIMSK